MEPYDAAVRIFFGVVENTSALSHGYVSIKKWWARLGLNQ